MTEMSVLEYVDSLDQIQLDGVFNPYTDICPTYDDMLSPAIRRVNLEYYLDQCLVLSPTTAWFGEGLGYRGGRRTGLPFSDEYHLAVYNQCYDFTSRRATRQGDMKEVTASTIWSMIKQLEQPPLLWNIFPFHPMDETALSNRRPKADELAIGRELTVQLLEIIGVDEIFAIGRTAESELDKIGLASTYVRHPSYGGANIFREQITEQYKL